VYPTICKNLTTDHKHTTALYRAARKVKGVNRISIASGLRYDLAVQDPEYVKELVTHHVGGYLKIAPEHTEDGVLAQMMKPKMSSYYEFKKMFEQFSREAGKKQYLIPYFIAAHPGTRDEDMVNMALWLKKNNFEVDQVQTFYPSPMSLATAMYVSERNPLKKLTYKSGKITIPRGLDQRRLHKALLRYHDPAGWPAIREALLKMRKGHLIGNSPSALIPADDGKAFVKRGGKPTNTAPTVRDAKASINGKASVNGKTSASSKPAYGAKPHASQFAPKKPAAQAFGDKFESAKKFNAKTAVDKPAGNRTGNTTGSSKPAAPKQFSAKPGNTRPTKK
jgi:hypothetical protein